MGPINNKPALVKIMAWHRCYSFLLSTTDAYMHHLSLHKWTMDIVVIQCLLSWTMIHEAHHVHLNSKRLNKSTYWNTSNYMSNFQKKTLYVPLEYKYLAEMNLAEICNRYM